MEQTQDTARPKLFSRCTVYGKFGAASRRPAVIIWGADDKIGVYLYDPTSNQYIAKVVEAYVREISEVMVTLALLTFHVGNRAYQVDFDPNALATLVGGAVASAGVDMGMEALGGAASSLSSSTSAGVGIGAAFFAQHMANDSGIDEWTAALQKSGLTADTTMRKPGNLILKILLIAIILLFVVLPLGIFIAALIESM